ncbi:dihydroneopterin aldolase [Falsiroseomonas selenitidurans]|uniref:7,8-dihydroneopterin aldolase n=1 Tax=Falsiroseomonas selenitidurans TaxID=2716335 RepID=A0ABX1DYV2_9PROT|nr:dihydroneopterin aldolase [Falsiroseomonas selenitidurans]NKC30001.1 dihydroneopterin aldolase [Falsiroseomonas selenitidurans]
MIYAPDAEAGRRVVFLRGLELMARLGIYAHEKAGPQRILLSVELVVADDFAPAAIGPDDFRRVVDYERLVQTARATVAQGHVLLVETLAEMVALAALEDPRVERARVTVEKPDAFTDVATVGVVVERRRKVA